ncbi:glycosyltransferase [Candidatus Micrarchaeota archaeon]|nr:glycosyltransferase [Candidatus Micrarchaeota archaeon]
MNIGFFTDTYLPNIDGVVTSILNYRGELERKEHKVFIFSSGDKQAIKNNHDPRVFFYDSIKFPPYPQYKLALFPFTAKAKCKENEIELIHCHAMASMGLAAIKTANDLDLPLVGTFHTLIPNAFKLISKKKWVNDIASTISWKAIKAFYKPFDVVTCPTKTISNLMAEEGIKSVVVPTAVDTNRFTTELDKQVIRKIFKIDKDEKIILTTGRVSAEKNLEVVVNAAELLLKERKAKFIISGDGPFKEELLKLVDDKGLKDNFIFTGFVEATELPFMYAASDCFVTASTFETQGLALLEAMACGKPVIGANAMAIPEAIDENKNGFLFQPFDALECSQKIIKVLDASAEDYKKMSANARKTAEKYSIEKSTEKLLDAYNQAKN